VTFDFFGHDRKEIPIKRECLQSEAANQGKHWSSESGDFGSANGARRLSHPPRLGYDWLACWIPGRADERWEISESILFEIPTPERIWPLLWQSRDPLSTITWKPIMRESWDRNFCTICRWLFKMIYDQNHAKKIIFSKPTIQIHTLSMPCMPNSSLKIGIDLGCSAQNSIQSNNDIVLLNILDHQANRLFDISRKIYKPDFLSKFNLHIGHMEWRG
jgi:hypothetical protein